VDVFSTGLQQKGHPASKSLHQLPLMECIFPPLLFLPFSCMRRTGWNGVKQDIWRGRVQGDWLIQVHLEGRQLNGQVCNMNNAQSWTDNTNFTRIPSHHNKTAGSCLIGCRSNMGGCSSANSIAVIPTAQMSHCWLYPPLRSTAATSGAILVSTDVTHTKHSINS